MKMKTRIAMVVITLAGLHLPARAGEEGPNLSPEYLTYVMQHLYRWHLDETALLVVDDADELEFLMRWQKPALDEDDRSRYIELLVPQLSYSLLLKKAEYEVPEMNITVENADYRIIRAGPWEAPPVNTGDYHRVTVGKKALIQYLFERRNQREYPDAELIERMRAALREQYAVFQEAPVVGPQTVYVAPISKVANNLWVFWENGRRIIRFSSDSDMTSKAFWEVEELGVKMYDLEKDVVLSHTEAAGSNAYVTRDWAARVLFNCVVFGQRLTLEPPPAE